jgi:hypothetical protein
MAAGALNLHGQDTGVPWPLPAARPWDDLDTSQSLGNHPRLPHVRLRQPAAPNPSAAVVLPSSGERSECGCMPLATPDPGQTVLSPGHIPGISPSCPIREAMSGWARNEAIFPLVTEAK